MRVVVQTHRWRALAIGKFGIVKQGDDITQNCLPQQMSAKTALAIPCWTGLHWGRNTANTSASVTVESQVA